MKKKLLITFYFIMSCLGVISFFYWKNRNKKIVLTYHNVIPDALFDGSCHLDVSHNELIFEKQIRLIARRFRNKKNFKERCLITFDDGYINQFEIAARILNQYNIQGMFFITFCLIMTESILTIDEIMMWVSYVPKGDYTVLGIPIKIDDTNRDKIVSKILEKLNKYSRRWDCIVSELNSQFNFASLSIHPDLRKLRFKSMQVNHLADLIKMGHVVASHGWDHKPLAIFSEKKQKEDFLKCKIHADKYCNSMNYSYPFGGIEEVSPVTAKLCAETGFASAYMNTPELPDWKNIDGNYTLPRISLPNESNQFLIDAKLSGFETVCKKFNKNLIQIFFQKKKIHENCD